MMMLCFRHYRLRKTLEKLAIKTPKKSALRALPLHPKSASDVSHRPDVSILTSANIGSQASRFFNHGLSHLALILSQS